MSSTAAPSSQPRPTWRLPTLLAGAVAFAPLFAAVPTHADEPLIGPNDHSPLFSISKSENRNEVVFGIHLDARCVPLYDAPVFAFWQMHEKGEGLTEPLLGREQPAYGIESQKVLARSADGGHVQVTLRAVPHRPIVVESRRVDGRCEAWSKITISGEDAYLYNVYAKLRPFGVEYLLLSGWATDESRVLHEKLMR